MTRPPVSGEAATTALAAITDSIRERGWRPTDRPTPEQIAEKEWADAKAERILDAARDRAEDDADWAADRECRWSA